MIATLTIIAAIAVGLFFGYCFCQRAWLERIYFCLPVEVDHQDEPKFTVECIVVPTKHMNLIAEVCELIDHLGTSSELSDLDLHSVRHRCRYIRESWTQYQADMDEQFGLLAPDFDDEETLEDTPQAPNQPQKDSPNE